MSCNFTILLFDIGTGALVQLGQIIFDLIVLHKCEANISHKLPFSSLIFGLLESQKSLQEPNEFLPAPVQPYIFRLKEKSVGVEEEPSGGIATEPSVAIDTQSPQPSSAVTSFFRSELRAIKEKQGIQDEKQYKVLTQLQGIEDLMYFSLIMFKCISPQDLSNPPMTRPVAVVATTSAQLEPLEAPLAQSEPDFASVPLEADPDPPVVIEAKKKKKKKKKAKKN